MKKLKPCPFCGGEAIVTVNRQTLRAKAFCDNCNVLMKRYFSDEKRIEDLLIELMTESWNRRAENE